MMKIVAALLCLMAPLCAFGSEVQEHRELVGLAEKYAIGDPGFDFGGQSFTLNFTVSDYIDHTYVTIDLYSTAECRNDTVDNEITDNGTYLNYTLSPMNKTGDGSTNQTSDVTMNFDPMTITEAPIYTESAMGASAVILFCMRFNVLSAPAPNGIEVNFIETIIELTVDLTSDFSIDDVAVAPKDKFVKKAEASFTLVAWECDSTGAAYGAGQTKNQGMSINICVGPIADDLAAGLRMRRIDSFTFTKGAVTQPCIANADTIVSYGLTILTCAEGYPFCMFETLLKAEFFTAAGLVSGSGSATLQFGGIVDYEAFDITTGA